MYEVIHEVRFQRISGELLGAQSSAKQSVNLQVYLANTVELTFHFR